MILDSTETNLDLALIRQETEKDVQVQASVLETLSRKDYLQALSAFDAAICEALAVSQKQAGTIARPNVAYATYVYSQMCGSGISMVRAAPLSRWVHSNFEHWHFGAIAGHARALLEGICSSFTLLKSPALKMSGKSA